jgi:hypothetical protein
VESRTPHVGCRRLLRKRKTSPCSRCTPRPAQTPCRSSHPLMGKLDVLPKASLVTAPGSRTQQEGCGGRPEPPTSVAHVAVPSRPTRPHPDSAETEGPGGPRQSSASVKLPPAVRHTLTSVRSVAVPVAPTGQSQWAPEPQPESRPQRVTVGGRLRFSALRWNTPDMLALCRSSPPTRERPGQLFDATPRVVGEAARSRRRPMVDAGRSAARSEVGARGASGVGRAPPASAGSTRVGDDEAFADGVAPLTSRCRAPSTTMYRA